MSRLLPWHILFILGNLNSARVQVCVSKTSHSVSVLWGIMLITSTCTVISYHKWFMKTVVEVLDPDRLFFLILFGHTLSFIYKMDRFFLNSWIGSIVFLLSVAKQFPCLVWLSHKLSSHKLSFELCGLCSLEIAHGISISCFVFYKRDSSNLGSIV